MAQPAVAQSTFKISGVSAAVVSPNNNVLILSATAQGSLIYFDTVAEKEVKKVEVDFQPTALAIQGNKLIAATKGSAILHVLDVLTGKELKEIKVPGEPIDHLACHPQKGFVYAANKSNEIIAVDIDKGTADKTSGKGQLLAMDISEGKYVYAGIQKPIKDILLVERGPAGTLRLSTDQANLRALMLKYEITGSKLKLVAANDNAAINGRGLGISADGKRIAMAGGGGWRSKTDPRANYAIAVFDTASMDTMLGQVDTGAYPNNIAFHPHLNLGAGHRTGANGEVTIFNAKSFAKKAAFKLPNASHTLLLFGAQGTKLICVTVATSEGDSHIVLMPLELNEKDREVLKAAYR
jgi:glutamine cyclotransferase